jgi:hypothetical protein
MHHLKVVHGSVEYNTSNILQKMIFFFNQLKDSYYNSDNN